jgi:hypothetical protein
VKFIYKKLDGPSAPGDYHMKVVDEQLRRDAIEEVAKDHPVNTWWTYTDTGTTVEMVSFAVEPEDVPLLLEALSALRGKLHVNDDEKWERVIEMQEALQPCLDFMTRAT